jgi:hypothetical protein
MKGKPRIDNPEEFATLGSWQTIQKHCTINYEKDFLNFVLFVIFL